MSTPEEEEFDYDNDDSWYEDAMNALDSPANNHAAIYTEEEIADMPEENKVIIRLRNQLLEKGFEYVELKFGDYLADLLVFSTVIPYRMGKIALAYQSRNHFIIIFQIEGEDDTVTHPLQVGACIDMGSHLGNYQFLEFFHLEEEIAEDQKDFNKFKINRDLAYKGKPSLEIYRSDNISVNQSIVQKIEALDPHTFEFYNEFLIIELQPGTSIDAYIDLIEKIGN